MSEAILALPTLAMFKQETGVLDKSIISEVSSLDDSSQSNTNTLFR